MNARHAICVAGRNGYSHDFKDSKKENANLQNESRSEISLEAFRYISVNTAPNPRRTSCFGHFFKLSVSVTALGHSLLSPSITCGREGRLSESLRLTTLVNSETLIVACDLNGQKAITRKPGLRPP
jgi:hypothetical protein